MTDRKPEEWREVPGWPGYQVSTMCRVRHVKPLVGSHMVLRAKGKQLTTTAQALFTKAFGKAATADGSRWPRYEPGEWQYLVKTFFANGPRTAEDFRKFVTAWDKQKYNIAHDQKILSHQLNKKLRQFKRSGLLERVAYATYRLTQGDSNAL